jgi:hypothetical protein
MRYLLAALILMAGTAAAQTPYLSDDDLVAYAQQFHIGHWPDPRPHGVVGLHRGFKVRIDTWCTGDNGCSLDYVIHCDLHPGTDCENAGGRTVEAPTDGTVVTRLQPFCVPRILADRKLFAGP